MVKFEPIINKSGVFDCIGLFLRRPIGRNLSEQELRRIEARTAQFQGDLDRSVAGVGRQLGSANATLDHFEETLVEGERVVSEARAAIKRSPWQPAGPAEEAQLARNGLWMDPRLSVSADHVGEGQLHGDMGGKILLHTDADGNVVSTGWEDPLDHFPPEKNLRDIGRNVALAQRGHLASYAPEALRNAGRHLTNADKVVDDYARAGLPAGRLDTSGLDAARTEYGQTHGRLRGLSDRSLGVYRTIFGFSALWR